MARRNFCDKLKALLADVGRPEDSWGYYSHDMELSGFFQPDNLYVWKTDDAGYTDGLKQHHRYVIKFLLSGKSSSRLDNHTLTLHPGEFFFVFPYQRHNELPPGPGEKWELLCINFMEAPGGTASILPLKNRVFKPDEIECRLFETICRGSFPAGRRHVDQTDARMALAWLIARLMNKASAKVEGPPKHATLTDEITEYISRNLDKKLSIRQLCKQFNVSATTLLRLFSSMEDCSGRKMSPGRFIRHTKLLRSAEWILSGKNTIKEIAAFCGYADQFSFSRAFKKIYGFSPMKLRKKK